MKRLEVKFVTPGDKTAITSNVSETGLFIRTNSGFDMGREAHLHVTLPTGLKLSLQGSVTRSAQAVPGLVGEAESGMGIQLFDPSEDYVQYIKSLHE